MSVTARHKRPGAFPKLVQSLETTPPERRVKILESLRSEDNQLADHAEESIFHFEEFIGVDTATLTEILEALKAEGRILALALHKVDPVLTNHFVMCMSPALKADYQVFKEGTEKVMQREQISAQFRIIIKARELETHGKIILKKYSGNYPGSL